MKKLFCIAAVFALAMCAADPKGFAIWKAAELKAYTSKLAPQINDQKLATEQIASFGKYSAMAAYRGGSGGAEVHEKLADLMVIEAGEGTLIVGGTVVGGKPSGPGEIRGTSVEGGERHPLAPGDIVTVPINTPHQVLVPNGKHITYFIIKIEN